MNKPNGSCECERIKAENERMREAIYYITIWSEPGYRRTAGIMDQIIQVVHDIAEKALKGGKP